MEVGKLLKDSMFQTLIDNESFVVKKIGHPILLSPDSNNKFGS